MDSRRSSTGQSSNAQSAIDPTRLKSSWEWHVTVLLFIQKLVPIQSQNLMSHYQ